MLFVLFLAQLASAHFVIKYPGTRGFNEDKIDQWPCGGFNEVSAERSEFPLSGAPIQIDSTHTEQLLQVLMAVGNNPQGNFNTELVPTVQETGPGNFCFGDVTIPTGLNITAGSNATIQIISGGHGGGLYGCVDVTFTSQMLTLDEKAQHCTNNTGIQVAELPEHVNANGSTSTGTAPPPAESSTLTAGKERVTVGYWSTMAMAAALAGISLFL